MTSVQWQNHHKMLIENVSDKNIVFNIGNTPFNGDHWSGLIKKSCIQRTQILLRRWVLNNAAHFLLLGNENVAELLIQNGANVHTVNNYGRTALTWAAKNGKK